MSMLTPGDDKAIAAELRRIERKKREQDFDPDPPRCGTCLYFSQGPAKQRREAAKRGRGIEHLQRCTFGNFRVTYKGVCDEWRNRQGDKIEQEHPTHER
ncbi:hypothetical protein [Arenimonas sp.]|uniref:hypothetical protein n=1 Tax=Arenimonas sp. TaxID=1872635 RepID=UPI0039E35466